MSKAPSRMPALFVSHGAPDIAVKPSPAHDFLRSYAAELPRPKAILVASAHWETTRPAVAVGPNPPTVYDFGGFDRRLYEMKYPAPRAGEVSAKAADLLAKAGFPTSAASDQGYDHGVWTPLILLYPEADIPVAQVSIQPSESAEHHMRIGRALRPLRDEGVMIIGSGAMTHNLALFFRGSPEMAAKVSPLIESFTAWMEQRLTGHATADLAEYWTRSPQAELHHPSDEHLLPLFVAYGATHDDEPIRRVHASIDRGRLAMDCYRFGL